MWIVAYMLMVLSYIWFQSKRFWNKCSPVCLGYASKESSIDDMKRTWLNGYIFYFSVDYAVLMLMMF